MRMYVYTIKGIEYIKIITNIKLYSYGGWSCFPFICVLLESERSNLNNQRLVGT